ncbi:MAG: carboxypeptidase regulatory-like domain-containing protein [Planctomycetes bacterium]|nr:carboxypeptidase regulatory-like domain-containing protein [Planctomycetota bacterium]
MRPRRPILALAVILIAGALWLLLWRGEPTPPQPPPPNPSSTTAPLAAESAIDAQPAAHVEREAADAAPPAPEGAPPAVAPAPALSGVVRESTSNKGVHGILVELLDAHGTTLLATTTDDEGRFAFDRGMPEATALATRPAPAGLPRLRHDLPGTNAFVRPGSRRPPPPTTITLWRTPDGTITGRVVDDLGDPVVGAKITTDRPYRPINSGPWRVLEGKEVGWILDVTTDADGRFVLPACKIGMHTLRAVHGERSGSVRVDSHASGVVIRLGAHLAGAAVLSGQLSDRLTNAPIGGAEVDVRRIPSGPEDAGTAMKAIVRTDPRGRFEVQGLELGDYNVHPMHRGYFGTTTKVAVQSGHRVVELSMLPARKVKVRVVLPDGQPIARASVQARDADGAIVQVPNDDHFPRDSLVTDAAGRVALRHLPAARLTLLAMRGDLHPAARVEVDLTHGAPEEVLVQLPNAVASFARQHFFKLMDTDGKPAAIEGTVVASSFDGDQLLSRVEGRWRGDTFYLGNHQKLDSKTPVMAVGAIAGACRVEIAAPGYQLVTLTLEPDAKSPTNVTLRR